MKLAISLIAILSASSASAFEIPLWNDAVETAQSIDVENGSFMLVRPADSIYCTRGEVITGATWGFVIGAVSFGFWEARGLATGTRVITGKLESSYMSVPKSWSQEEWMAHYGTWFGDTLKWTDEVVGWDEVAKRPGFRSIVAGSAIGGALIGTATGAFAGCVSGPILDNFWEDTWAQQATQATTGAVVGAAGWTSDKVVTGVSTAASWTSDMAVGAWEGVSGGVVGWWNTPTSIVKRETEDQPTEEPTGEPITE
jgi:uncharacterized membrane protein